MTTETKKVKTTIRKLMKTGKNKQSSYLSSHLKSNCKDVIEKEDFTHLLKGKQQRRAPKGNCPSDLKL